jgi:hypothetical protein
VKSFEARLRRRSGGQVFENLRHRWPGTVGVWISSGVSVAGLVGNPAGGAAVGHRYRHAVAARRQHVTKRRLVDYAPQLGDQLPIDGTGVRAQQHGTRREGNVLSLRLEQVANHAPG